MMREGLIEFVSAMRELDAERVSAALEQNVKMGERASGLALRTLRSQESSPSERPHGSPLGSQQVEPSSMEFGCALPKMPPPSSMDVRLLPIQPDRHLPSLAATTPRSLQCVGTDKRAHRVCSERLKQNRDTTASDQKATRFPA